MTTETAREEAVNPLLGQLLRARGIKARAERRSRGDTPDIRFELRTGELILIECKWESNMPALDDQLDQRVHDFPEAVARVGVLYPDDLKYVDDIHDELEHTLNLQWYLHSSRARVFDDRTLREGTIEQFAGHLRLLPLEIEGVDRVVAAAGAVGYGLDQAASEMRKHARVARLIAEAIAETDDEKDKAAAQRIGCLVLFNALAFQDRLATIRDDVPSLNEVTGDDTSRLEAAWRAICDEIDYVPVFELAADLLKILGYAPPPTARMVLRPLLRAVEQTRLVEGHDLSGRLFHTLLSDAKFTGAYYTSVPAATLLARLVFENWPPNIDWADHEFPASLNVADLACGTGTLLMAVAAEAERRHQTAGGRQSAELHKAMVEQALHGYDVQLSAVHFAATSLAALNPEIDFDRMNLYQLDLGAASDRLALGSLDFLGSNEVPVQRALSRDYAGTTSHGVGRISGTTSRPARETTTAVLPPLDLAIMNPPFTRSVGGNLLFGSVPGPERSKLQSELRHRLKSRSATATAGLGAPFVAAVAPKLHPGEGRLALVLPVRVCTGRSWSQTRTLIESEFRLETVITSHDPKRWKFSEDAKYSDALLIATRRSRTDDEEEEHRTTFVNLWRNPSRIFDAGRLADAICNTTPAPIEESGMGLLTVDGDHVGVSLSIPESQYLGSQWRGMQFARTDLTRSAIRLLNRGEVWLPGSQNHANVPMIALGSIAEIGPDRRDIWDGFERTDAVTAYPMVEDHHSDVRRTMATNPDKYLAPLVEPLPGRRLKPIHTLWPKAGRLLIAERLRLTNARVVGMCASQAVLSNSFWPAKTATADVDAALAVWLNSSLGLLTLLATRNTTEGGWVDLKKGDLERLHVLDVQGLSPPVLAQLVDLFAKQSDAEFLPFPEMAHCSVRAALDTGLSQALGLPDLGGLRHLLASEPVISNQQL